MTTREISLSIISACKSSVELNDYITLTYSKDLTYARGLNLDIDYYSENEYADVPILIIDPEKNKFESEMGNTFSITLHIKIAHEDEFKNGFSKIDNVITLDGIDEVETIGEYIKTAIEQEFASALDVLEMDLFVDPLTHVSNFSEYNGHLVLTFQDEATIGGCL